MKFSIEEIRNFLYKFSPCDTEGVDNLSEENILAANPELKEQEWQDATPENWNKYPYNEVTADTFDDPPALSHEDYFRINQREKL